MIPRPQGQNCKFFKAPLSRKENQIQKNDQKDTQNFNISKAGYSYQTIVRRNITKKLGCMDAVVPDWRRAGLVKHQGRPNARKSVSGNGIHEYSHNRTLLARFSRSNTRIQRSFTEETARSLIKGTYRTLRVVQRNINTAASPIKVLRSQSGNDS